MNSHKVDFVIDIILDALVLFFICVVIICYFTIDSSNGTGNGLSATTGAGEVDKNAHGIGSIGAGNVDENCFKGVCIELKGEGDE